MHGMERAALRSPCPIPPSIQTLPLPQVHNGKDYVQMEVKEPMIGGWVGGWVGGWASGL